MQCESETSRHRYWNRTLANEGAMDLTLPSHGIDVGSFAKHSITRMMITRRDMYHPRYGAPPLYYASCCDGFQDVFVADFATYLEWGFFDTARGVLDNYFTYYVRRNATVLYRGPELAQYGRTLTLVAQYHRLTGDTALLVKHAAKIVDFSSLLIRFVSLPRSSRFSFSSNARWKIRSVEDISCTLRCHARFNSSSPPAKIQSVH